jgi:hypothetical protein
MDVGNSLGDRGARADALPVSDGKDGTAVGVGDLALVPFVMVSPIRTAPWPVNLPTIISLIRAASEQRAATRMAVCDLSARR